MINEYAPYPVAMYIHGRKAFDLKVPQEYWKEETYGLIISPSSICFADSKCNYNRREGFKSAILAAFPQKVFGHVLLELIALEKFGLDPRCLSTIINKVNNNEVIGQIDYYNALTKSCNFDCRDLFWYILHMCKIQHIRVCFARTIEEKELLEGRLIRNVGIDFNRFDSNWVYSINWKGTS